MVTITVCTTCRRMSGGDPSDQEPRPGAQLLAELEQQALPEGTQLRPVECLSACSNGSVVALSAPGFWTYVYGRMSPENAPDIAAGVALYAASEDGIVPWRDRPEIFRKQTVARIPPQE